MSTFRIARHTVDMDTGEVGVDRRAVALVLVLCLALFAGCYAIGRAASPRGHTAGQPAASLPVAFAGAAAPFQLSSAPAIRIQAPRPHPHAPAASRSAGVSVARANAPAPAPAPAQAQGPVREVARSPAPVQAPSAPAPASARGNEGGGSQPHTSSGPGASFDSSG